MAHARVLRGVAVAEVPSALSATVGTARPALDASEQAIVDRLSTGARPEEIAIALGVSLATVRKKIARAKRKRGARTLAELVAGNAGRDFSDVKGAEGVSGRARVPAASMLTGVQLEIVELLADGLRYRDVATRLSISERQVQRYVQAAIKRLGVRNSVELVAALANRTRTSAGDGPALGTERRDQPRFAGTAEYGASERAMAAVERRHAERTRGSEEGVRGAQRPRDQSDRASAVWSDLHR